MSGCVMLSCQLGLNQNSVVPHGLQIAALITDWGRSDVTSFLPVITLTEIHSLHGMCEKAPRNVLKICCSNYEINKSKISGTQSLWQRAFTLGGLV